MMHHTVLQFMVDGSLTLQQFHNVDVIRCIRITCDIAQPIKAVPRFQNTCRGAAAIAI